MNIFKKLCMKCMHEIGNNDVCPYCGKSPGGELDPSCIRPGSVLEDRYLIGECLNKNSEGIGYIGYDLSNESIIYIKEFMPEKLCARVENKINIEVVASYKQLYTGYLNQFLSVARSLARLRDISSINPLYDIFEDNNTAYYVTDFIHGDNLNEFVYKRHNGLSWETVRTLFMPLLSALEKIHNAGVLHLGISPDNLIITSDEKIKLCGFSIPEIRQSNTIIDSELFDGYSAPEQYIIRGPISESTDVYGFCACLIFTLSGRVPPTAASRSPDSKLLVSKNVLKDIPPRVIAAIANGLAISLEDRINSFSQLREELSPVRDLVTDNNEQIQIVEEPSKNISGLIIALCLIFIISTIVVGGLCINNLLKNQNTHVTTESKNNTNDTSNLNSSEKNSSQIIVPNLSGVSFKDAQKAANSSSDYEILLSNEEFSDTIVAGRIISQIPEAGAKIKKGSVIIVNISKGSKIRTLPEVEGLTLPAASNKISSAGFVPKKEEAFSDNVSRGLVIGYKDHQPDDVLEYGTEVTIIISKGPKEE